MNYTCQLVMVYVRHGHTDSIFTCVSCVIYVYSCIVSWPHLNSYFICKQWIKVVFQRMNIFVTKISDLCWLVIF